MTAVQIDYFKTPVGELIIGVFDEKLCLCDWRFRKKRTEIDHRIQKDLKAKYEENPENPLISETKTQLNEYFSKERKTFDLSLLFAGTEFQKQIWNLLLEIPYGKTLSYLELSRKFGDEKAIRAVGNANGANAIAIIVPCHRVVATNGKLTGYAGGLNAKKRLLELESDVQQLELFV